MQKCRKCTNQFKWKEIFQSIMFAYKPLVCKNCGLQHNVKFSFRVINALIITIPLMINVLFHFQSNYTFYVFIIYIVLIGLLMPFWTKYSHVSIRE